MLAPCAISVSSVDALAHLLCIYTLTPNAQIWPRQLNGDIDGRDGLIYPVIKDIGTTSGSGFDFVMGSVFLQRFYSVYDTTNSRVGFATTPYTDALIN